MDDKTQKERLEQELRFLKESFEAEVISKEEFEKGKDRIEKKLKEIQSTEIKQVSEETKEQIEAPKKEEATQKQPEKIRLKVIQNETEEHQYFEQSEKIEQKETQKQSISQEPKKKSKFFKYAVVFIILVLIAFFSYSLLKGSMSKSQEKTTQVKFVAACNSDEDCKREGKEGFCLSPGAKDAKCEFKDGQKTNVLVLNDKTNCFNCDTQRVISILEDWFGPLNVKEFDYNSAEGKNLTERFDVKTLPMYVFNENITNKPNYAKLQKIFIKKGGNYILSDDVAGSSFYPKRENIPNKLDLLVISGDNTSLKAENNLKEFLESFKEVKFDRHLSDDNLAKELGIKNFPAFLVNNRVKFSGVLAAETIKENFCKLNKLPECEKSLSKSLV